MAWLVNWQSLVVAISRIWMPSSLFDSDRQLINCIISFSQMVKWTVSCCPVVAWENCRLANSTRERERETLYEPVSCHFQGTFARRGLLHIYRWPRRRWALTPSGIRFFAIEPSESWEVSLWMYMSRDCSYIIKLSWQTKTVLFNWRIPWKCQNELKIYTFTGGYCKLAIVSSYY